MVKDLTGITGAQGSPHHLPQAQGLPTPGELPKHCGEGVGNVKGEFEAVFGIHEKTNPQAREALAKVAIFALGTASQEFFPAKNG